MWMSRFLTHLHGSTRKNKRERVEIAKGEKKKKKAEKPPPKTRERSDVFLWMMCVMQLADCLLTVPQSSRHASPADSAIRKKEREGRNFTNVTDIQDTGITRLSSRIFEPVFHTRDLSGVLREVLEKDAHRITLYRTAYAVSNHASVVVGKFSSTASSHKPEMSGLSWPRLAALRQATVSKETNKMHAHEGYPSERVYGPCRFSI